MTDYISVLIPIFLSVMFWVCAYALEKERIKNAELQQENSELVRNNLRLSYLLDAKKDLIEIQEKIIGDYEKKE